MRLHTFGRLQLEMVEFSRPKPLLLLAYLALEGAQDRRTLAELFWPGSRNHMNSLTVALTRLRGGVAGSIETEHDRVWTTIDTDAGAFLDLLRRRDLAGALELYRGPFLEGAYDRHWSTELEEWVYKTREFLAGHARRARLELAEREAAMARFEAATRHAEEAFAITGAAPEPDDLVRLHTLLLAGGSLKADRVRGEAAEFGLSLAGSSEQARKQLRDAHGGPARHAPHNLPAHATGFVGRDLDLTEVATLLGRSDGRVSTLVGTAGVGKTRLAVQVAQDQVALGSFAGGVYVVSLEYVTSPEALPVAIADALGVDLPRPESRLDQLTAEIGDDDTLLVLDNFEHLMAAASTVARLVAACPRLTVLVTSRERLNLEGEHIYRVEGLPFPSDENVSLEEAQRFDAIRLFVRRAKMARPGFELTESNLPPVRTICRLAEGLPLALELAATWLRAMPVHEIARELDHGLDMLSSSNRDRVERHRSMRAAFEHSWELLPAHEREVLRRSSCFKGGFRRHAARHLTGATLAVLASLVDKSLLRVDATGRFDRHPLLYQYVLEKLHDGPSEVRATRELHARYYLQLLRSWDDRIRSGEQHEVLEAMDEELENLRAACTWATLEARMDDLLHAIAPLVWFFKIRGRRQEGIAFLDRVEQSLQGRDAAARAVLGSAFTAKARLYQDLGRYDEAARLARHGLAWVDPQRDGAGMIRGLDTLGRVAWRSGHPEKGRIYWEKALRLAQRYGDEHTAVILLGDVAMIEQELGEYAEAERHYREALATSRAHGNQLHVIRNLNNLGELLFVTGRADQARASWREGLALAEEIGFRGIVPHLTLNLGMAALDAGDLGRAASLHATALQQARESGDQALEAMVLARQARLATARDAFEEAEEAVGTALELAWSIRDMPAVLCAVVCLAELRADRGHLAEAAGLLSLTLRDSSTSPYDQQRMKQLLSSLRDRLGATTLVDAIEEGQARNLTHVVEHTLRESLEDR